MLLDAWADRHSLLDKAAPRRETPGGAIGDIAEAQPGALPPGTPPQLLTVEQIAGLMGVTKRRVHTLVKQGKLPHLRIGSAFRFRPADLDAYQRRRLRRRRGPIGGRRYLPKPQTDSAKNIRRLCGSWKSSLQDLDLEPGKPKALGARK